MSDITMYSTGWCGYCRNLKKQLDAKNISYEVVDIEEKEDAGEFVASVNGGNRVVPTLKFSDGSTLTNPSIKDVEAKLAELA